MNKEEFMDWFTFNHLCKRNLKLFCEIKKSKLKL